MASFRALKRRRESDFREGLLIDDGSSDGKAKGLNKVPFIAVLSGVVVGVILFTHFSINYSPIARNNGSSPHQTANDHPPAYHFHEYGKHNDASHSSSSSSAEDDHPGGGRYRVQFEDDYGHDDGWGDDYDDYEEELDDYRYGDPDRYYDEEERREKLHDALGRRFASHEHKSNKLSWLLGGRDMVAMPTSPASPSAPSSGQQSDVAIPLHLIVFGRTVENTARINGHYHWTGTKNKRPCYKKDAHSPLFLFYSPDLKGWVISDDVDNDYYPFAVLPSQSLLPLNTQHDPHGHTKHTDTTPADQRWPIDHGTTAHWWVRQAWWDEEHEDEDDSFDEDAAVVVQVAGGYDEYRMAHSRVMGRHKHHHKRLLTKVREKAAAHGEAASGASHHQHDIGRSHTPPSPVPTAPLFAAARRQPIHR